MTLADLIASFREDANDLIEPYFWPDQVLTRFLAEAQDEAAYRALLIQDAATPTVCEVAVPSGTRQVTIHQSIFEIVHAQWEGSSSEPVHLPVLNVHTLNATDPDWRGRTGVPIGLVHNDTNLRLVTVPDVSGVIRLEVHRLPLKALCCEFDKPEIAAKHHRMLVHWALHRAFSKPDAEVFDAARASSAEAAFTAYFGRRPDANERRWHMADGVVHVTAPSPL